MLLIPPASIITMADCNIRVTSSGLAKPNRLLNTVAIKQPSKLESEAHTKILLTQSESATEIVLSAAANSIYVQ